MALVRARWRFAWRVASDQQATASEVRRTVDTVLEENAETLMRLPGVVGTGLSESSGQPCVRVLVDKMTPELLEQIPTSLEGYAVAVEETGKHRAADAD